MAQRGMIDRVVALARRAMGARPARVAAVQLGPMPNVDFKTTTGFDPKAARSSRASSLASAFSDPWEQTRVQRYRDYREMVEEVPELSRSLDVYVDLIFGDSEAAFEVIYSDGARPEVKRIIDSCIADLSLQKEIKKIVHEGLWLGDSFTELVYGDVPVRLVSERAWSPESVTVRENENGYLTIYEVKSDELESGRPLVPFQVIHYAPNAVRGARYGRSLFHSARYLRRHHDVFTDVTAMLCLRRAAGDTYFLWPVPDSLDQQAIDDYLRQLHESVDVEVVFESSGQLRRRAAASLDTVPKTMPYRVITNDQGEPVAEIRPTVVETKSADLRQMVDVLKYLQDRFFIATGVPKALVGLERDVNARATLEVQGLHFAVSVRARQREAAELLTDIFTRALLVEGVTPEDGEYAVRMPDSSSFDEQLRADVFMKNAAGVLSLVNAGTPLRAALAQGLGYDDQTLDRIMAAVDVNTVTQETLTAAVEAAAKWGFQVVVEGTERSRRQENQPA